MSVGDTRFYDYPKWLLGTDTIENVNSLDTLGVILNKDCNSYNHVNTRVQKSYRSYYSLRNFGFSYPGVNSDVKAYLWKSVCQPTLSYGCETINMNKSNIINLETCQGIISLSKAQESVNFQEVHIYYMLWEYEKLMTLLYKTQLLFGTEYLNINSPTRRLCSFLYDKYMSTGIAIPGTLVHRLTYSGMSPAYCALQKNKYISSHGQIGLIDSLKVVLSSENFTKPQQSY